MQQKFDAIKKEYESYYSELLSKHKLLRETSLGYYGASPADAVFSFFRKISLEKKKSFVDLGSGDGKIVLIAALFTKAAGIEIDDELVKDAERIKKKLSMKAEFILGDYLDHDLSKYDIFFLNPDNHFPELEKKLRKEMKKDARLVVFGRLYKPMNIKMEKSIVVGGIGFYIYSRS